jgi:RNA-directed DNA polymerase
MTHSKRKQSTIKTNSLLPINCKGKITRKPLETKTYTRINTQQIINIGRIFNDAQLRRWPHLDLINRNTNYNMMTLINIRKYSDKRRTGQGSIQSDGWHTIDWIKANEYVEHLQGKIVEATCVEDWKRVYNLQRQIVMSFSGRALAIRRVVTNSGGKTPGIDGIVWRGSDDYMTAIEALKEIVMNPKGYRASPLRRVYIPKGDSGDTRPLGIPTLLDRTVQAVYHLALDPVVETRSDPNSFGFRKRRSCHDAITALRNHLDKWYSARWILDADLSKCFDKISHEFLLKHTKICDKTVLQQWLKSGVMEEDSFSMTTEGTPQGGIISPTLCNVALNGLEDMIHKTIPWKKGKTPKIHVIRYADDFVVLGSNPEMLGKVKIATSTWLADRGLEFNEKKTSLVHIRKGFVFLGFNISRKNWNPRLNKMTDQETVLVIEPAIKGIRKLKKVISETILKESPIERIISTLNPILRGWTEYFRISYHSQRIFIKIEYHIFWLMVRWSAKHGGSLRKTMAKYTRRSKTRKWNWGVSDTLKLFNPSEAPIIAHTPLKLSRNPYDPNDKEYFEKRIEKRVLAKFRAAVYRRHNNICPICNQSLNNGENIELHHIKPAKDGGKYKLNNIVPLHQICHQKVTHLPESGEYLDKFTQTSSKK